MDELAEAPVASGRPWPATSLHEEALARIEFILRKPNGIGLVVGPRGTGKSLLLQHTAAQRRRCGEPIALLDATALLPSEALQQLAQQWQHPAAVHASPARLWQAITDVLVMQRHEQRNTVALVDNVGDASFELLDLLLRVVHAGEMLQAPLVLVLTTDAARISHLGAGLLNRVNLRIDLTPLELADVQDYLRLHFDEQQLGLLTDDAVARLFALTSGLPRRLHQLTELVMLAAKGEGHAVIDATMVDVAYRELSVQSYLR